MPKTAVRYANGLVDANVGSLDRLKKKLAKNPRFLSQLEFDEDDLDEILSKLSLGGTIEESSREAAEAKAKEAAEAEAKVKADREAADAAAKVKAERETAEAAAKVKADREAIAGKAVPSEETASLALVGTLQTTLSGHADCVTSVVELPDRRLFSGSRDNLRR